MTFNIPMTIGMNSYRGWFEQKISNTNKKRPYFCSLTIFMMKRILLTTVFLSMFNCICLTATAQVTTKMYRIAKIKVDANQLELYQVALNEQMNAAIQLEPGVDSPVGVK